MHLSSMIFTVGAVLCLAACGESEKMEKNEFVQVDAPSQPLVIYSPSPPMIMLHQHNVVFGDMLRACDVENSVEAIALPQSVNQFADVSNDDKKYHLPIMTTIDFLPAIMQAGPAWHAYSTRNADLKFVSSLYDVAFGVLTFDDEIVSPADLKGKRIGAPPRPSAVRVYTEALLRDGWGIIDEVEIVDILPPALAEAIENGDIDATTWNLLSVGEGRLEAMAPALLVRPGAHWIGADDGTVQKINDANAFKIERSLIDDGEGEKIGLLSFRQALAAWDATPAQTVERILTCMERGEASGVLPSKAQNMAQWPQLSKDNVHAAALQFYQQRGVMVE